MKASTKSDIQTRLARVGGQLSGISKMIDEERYCVDILTQVAALRAALDQCGLILLSEHLESCVYGDDHRTDRSEEERVDEIKRTLNRFLK